MLRRNNVPPGIAPADHRATARPRHLATAGPPRQAGRRPANGRSLAALPPPAPHGDCRRNPPARRHRGSLVGGSRHRARQGRGNPGSRRGIARQDAAGLGPHPARRREPRSRLLSSASTRDARRPGHGGTGVERGGIAGTTSGLISDPGQTGCGTAGARPDNYSHTTRQAGNY